MIRQSGHHFADQDHATQRGLTRNETGAACRQGGPDLVNELTERGATGITTMHHAAAQCV
jgi:hypothetical protein